MKDTELRESLRSAKAKCEARAEELLLHRDPDLARLYESMRYSMTAGGKRLRPFLVMAMSEIFGGEPAVALDFAVALEMVHTYSLIHDDLPAMDNDDYRRGLPTNHKKFGEATALLAGDALLTLAFSVIADAACPPADAVSAVRALSRAAGVEGMLGGQMMDMEAEKKAPDLLTLTRLHSRKTGALMIAGVELGLIAAGVTNLKIWADARAYAEKLGRAFQIKDDLLDVYGDEKLLGKRTGQDARDGKATYVTLMGQKAAETAVVDLTEEAKASLSAYPGTDVLLALADELTKREH